MTECKIATWNLCLGLSNKKDLIKETLFKENILVCCMQEIDIIKGYPLELLNFPGYNLEIETNDLKSRVGIYISKIIPYKRRIDIEGSNSNIVIVDLLKN